MYELIRVLFEVSKTNAASTDLAPYCLTNSHDELEKLSLFVCDPPLSSALLLSVFVLSNVFSVCGCGVSTPLPELGKHQSSTPVVVANRLPETVEVQMLSQRPDDTSVWVDGYWDWNGRRWVWKAGAWVQPVPAGHYAKPEYVMKPLPESEVSNEQSDDASRRNRQNVVELQFRPGAWYGPDGGVIAEGNAVDGGMP